MGWLERKALIANIEADRDGRLLLSYVTSTRNGHEVQIGDEVVRVMYEVLERNTAAAAKGVDLFIHSNGGSATTPWRIVNLIREYTKNFAVLVPHRAFSAATLIALGADEIVMHRMGCLGPIDPSIQGIFNPPHPNNPLIPAPISVEDVSAYFKLIKDEVGITHEDELVKTVIALTEKVHPLALGNVQRSHHQSRMTARKLLKKHTTAQPAAHEIEQLIDTLKSNLFFHGHPINRDEAAADLKLKVKSAEEATSSKTLGDLMWKLYVDYEDTMSLREPFHAPHELEKRLPTPSTPPAPTVPDIVQQMQQLAGLGLGLGPGGLTPEQMVEMATAMARVQVTPTSPNFVHIDGIPGAYCEGASAGWVFKTDLRLERIIVPSPNGPQPGTRQEVRWQRWEEEK